MTEHLDLDAIRDDRKPSLTFDLGGKKFRCRQPEDLPWGVMERWYLAQAENNTRELMSTVDDFFRAVLFADDVEPFMEFKSDPQGPLTQKRAMALIQGINAQLLKGGGVDPTQQPKASRATSRTTASSSKAKRSSRATRTSAA